MLTIKNLSKNFSKVKALDNVSFELKKGEILGIVGESGSGKSTLAKVITRIVKPDGGSILFKGEDFTKLNSAKLREYRKNVQMVFQNPNSTFSPRMNIGDFLCEGMLNFKLASKKEALKKAKEYLELVKLPTDIMERLPHQLSGGQLQRVCIARAIATKPKFIMLDEAVSSLDVSTQVEILDLLQKLKKEYNLSYIFVTHDLLTIAYICNSVIFFKDGKIEEEISDIKNLKNIKKDYSRKLLNAVIEF